MRTPPSGLRVPRFSSDAAVASGKPPGAPVGASRDGPLYLSGKNQRNVAVIAHVDHGKTSLVDKLLRFTDASVTGSMDSNVLERERGITILAKCTSLTHNGVLFNIVDTPGHADFGGEVERILSMVDGVLLVVDALGACGCMVLPACDRSICALLVDARVQCCAALR